jgi:hypothetical protein
VRQREKIFKFAERRIIMPAIIPLVAIIVFFITVLLNLIHFIVKNEGVVISAIMLCSIVIIDIQTLLIIVYDRFIGQDTTS